MSNIVHKAIEPKNISAKTMQALNEKPSDWVISPKYDGCHVIFAFDEGQCIGVYSRSGESVKSMGHIATSLLDLYPIGMDRLAVCGEAWLLGKPFNEISGAFRRHSPQPQLNFVPFDIVSWDYEDDNFSGPPVMLNAHQNSSTYIERIQWLKDNRRDMPSNILSPTFEVVPGTIDEVWKTAKLRAMHYKNSEFNHYDGVMLAKADALYEVGSGKGAEFIKCKPLISETVTVIDISADVGEKTGKNTLALVFSYNNNIQKVSTGLTQTEIDAYVAMPHLIIGQRIEVEAMGYTPNQCFREPRYKGIRADA